MSQGQNTHKGGVSGLYIYSIYIKVADFSVDPSLAVCASSFQVVVLLQSITSALTLSWLTLCFVHS